jgi:hypothetical protein
MKLIRCSYPNCVLEEHLEGDHKLDRPDKPWGTLRQTQTFEGTCTGGVLRCDYCAPELGQSRPPDRAQHWVWRAVAFYIDMLGFGWALCAECARKFATTEDTDHQSDGRRDVACHVSPLKPSTVPIPPKSPDPVPAPAKILKFARRNA